MLPCSFLSLATPSLVFQPFPKQQILDSSKLKEFADNNFTFDENDGKLSKQVEKYQGKSEKLLVTSDFSFSHSVFKRLGLQTCIKKGLFGKGFK